MKVLQAFVVAGLLTGTACQQIPPKAENVSAETGSLEGTAAGDEDAPAAPQLEHSVRRLQEELSLTEQQTKDLDKIFKEARAKREVLATELRDLSIKRQERMNAILTQEQRELYEKKRWEAPAIPKLPGHRKR
jgi:Spy/CpxP family protein refolding chaperone